MPGSVATVHTEAVRAVKDAVKESYFAPVCTVRHLSVRYYNWEPSRYLGDLAHLAALVLCLAVLLRERRATDGVSFKTHVIFFFVFSSRFMNVFFCDQPVYMVIYKVLLWTFTLKIIGLLYLRGPERDEMDTLPIVALLLPTIVVTIAFGHYTVEDHGLAAEVLWIFSMYLEAVAMLPQYLYCYRDYRNKSPLVFAYVFAMGFYQMVFGLNWAYHYVFSPAFLDMSSFLAGILGIVFFTDYLVFKVKGRSALSHICISVDEVIRDAEGALAEQIDEAKEQILGADDVRRVAELPVLTDPCAPRVAAGSPFSPVHGSESRPALWPPRRSLPAEVVGKPIAEVELAGGAL